MFSVIDVICVCVSNVVAMCINDSNCKIFLLLLMMLIWDGINFLYLRFPWKFPRLECEQSSVLLLFKITQPGHKNMWKSVLCRYKIILLWCMCCKILNMWRIWEFYYEHHNKFNLTEHLYLALTGYGHNNPSHDELCKYLLYETIWILSVKLLIIAACIFRICVHNKQ